MVQMTIYGKQSSVYEYLKMKISDSAKMAGLELQLNEINDTAVFVEEKLMQIPAVKIDGNLIYNSSSDINNYIMEVTDKLLKKENYGELKKVVVPIDFSDHSHNAVKFAIQLSKYMNCVIELVHYFRPRLSKYATSGNTYELTEKESNEILKTYVDNLKKQNFNVPFSPKFIKSRLEVGSVIDGLKNDFESDSLVIMGSQGEGNSFAKTFGSVSTTVAQKGNNDTIIVPGNYNFKPFQEILFCTEDPQKDIKAIFSLVELAELFDAKIHVVHFNIDDAKPLSYNLIEAFRSNYSKHKIVFETVEAENIVQGVSDYAEKESIDLITISRSSKGFLENLFSTSFTKQLVMYSNIPIHIINVVK